MMKKVVLLMHMVRAPFIIVIVVPVLTGTAVAWYQTGAFNIYYCILSIVGVILIHAGTNCANDYVDHKSGTDDSNTNTTPYSGGSRVIQDGYVLPQTMLYTAAVCFMLACSIGIYLTSVRGLALLVIGGIGVVSGIMYSVAPIRAVYRGWGEIVVAINCGPLVVSGAYYVQTGQLHPGILVVSIPIGLFTAAVLFINQFPDYESDKAANKQTLVVILGPYKARTGYMLFVSVAYALIAVASIARWIPLVCIAALATAPYAYSVAATLNKYYMDSRKLVPAMRKSITVYLVTGIMLSLGYIAHGAIS